MRPSSSVLSRHIFRHAYTSNCRPLGGIIRGSTRLVTTKILACEFRSRFYSFTRNLDSNTPTGDLEKALDEQDALDTVARSSSPGTLTACPGCGALAQTVEPGEPGYYSLKRKAVSSYVKQYQIDPESVTNVAAEALDQADAELVQSLGLDKIRDESM